ncbi:hypothetical protein HOD61_03360 [archaeon]|jgi:hypothetical protein|nr:hypothetical protein [archaeon]
MKEKINYFWILVIVSLLIILLLNLFFPSINLSLSRDRGWSNMGCGLEVCGQYSCEDYEMCQRKSWLDPEPYLPHQEILKSKSNILGNDLFKKIEIINDPNIHYFWRYRCHESSSCYDSNTCDDGLDNDLDTSTDTSDPSCVIEDEYSVGSNIRTEETNCEILFNSEAGDESLIAEGEGVCLSNFEGRREEMCLALTTQDETWTSIMNLNHTYAESILNNYNLCESYWDSCCVKIEEFGADLPIYQNSGSVNDIDYFTYCGDGYCQGWDHEGGVPTNKLTSWVVNEAFIGETFSTCSWINTNGTPDNTEDDYIDSDCPLEEYNCTVTDDPTSGIEYLQPIGNLYLSNKTNAHISLTSGEDFNHRVYCSYASYYLSSEGDDFIRISDETNAHAELFDRNNEGYETYKLNTNEGCFMNYNSPCPADDDQQTFCVLSLSSLTNAHVGDCTESNYPWNICCHY